MKSSKAADAQSASQQRHASADGSAARLQLGLSQRLGNQNLRMLLGARRLQAKLTVSHPQDVLEQEADRVAEHVMRMPEPVQPAPVNPVQGRTADAGVEVHRASGSDADVPAVDAGTEHAIQSLSGRGSALPEPTRAFMESRFNTDFSAVRVHSDPDAQQLARAVSAQAFTVGRDIVFGAGRYAPDTDGGKRLLAHELAHTIQQGATPSQVARAPETHASAPSSAGSAKHGAGKPGGADPRGVLTEYSPVYLDHGSASQLAKRGIELLLKHQVGRNNLGHFKLIVVTDRVYIFSTSGQLEKSFELTGAPPDRGFFWLGERRDDVIRLVSAGGTNVMAPVSRRNPKYLPWVTQWSKMTAADEAELLPAGTIPVLIIPGRPAPATSTSKGGKQGGGGTQRSKTSSNVKGKKPVELKRPPSGDEYEGRDPADDSAKEPANYGAFPAEIILSSKLVPVHGANELTMHLHWEFLERDMLSAVWNASTMVAYNWEIWNVTDILKAGGTTAGDVAKAQRQTPRDKGAKADDQFIEHDAEERTRELKEQIQNSWHTIDDGGSKDDAPEDRSHDVAVEKFNLALAPVSAIRTAGGHLIDSVWRKITKPDNTIARSWNTEGQYLIRCIAYPQEHEGQRYAPSVSMAFVEVRPADYIARDALARAEKRLYDLRLERELSRDPRHNQSLDDQIADLETSAHGSAVEALTVAVKRKQAEIASARGREREKLEDELHSLSMQLKFAEQNEEDLPIGPDGKKSHALRPMAALTSRVTGTTLPLLLQLRPVPPTAPGARAAWTIFDVTTKGDSLADWYTGQGATNGDAIRNAFHRFAHGNEYGPGTLILHIPDSIPDVATRDLVEQNVRGGDKLAKDRLNDLVTVLTAASLVVPGLGEAAMYLGGVLGTKHIVDRWRHGTLEWDAVLVSDLLSVLGAVGSGAMRVGELMVVESGGNFAIALESGDAQAIKNALKGVDRAARVARGIEIGNQLVLYGSLAWGEDQMLRGIQSINKAERDGTMTHFEAASERSKAMLGAIQSHAFLFTSLWHSPRGHGEEPVSREEPLRETTTRSGDRNVAGTGKRPPRRPIPPLRRPPRPESVNESPERLFELLGQGVDTALPPAPLKPASAKPAAVAEESVVFRRGLTTGKAAYDAYNEALAVSRGHEVGIYYDEATGEYCVMMGDEAGVERPDGDFWIALLHFHPNPDNVLTFRLPSGRDFHGLERAFREGKVIREFIEYDIPGVGRGRTEYGVDPAAKKPYYVRIHRADGIADPPVHFADLAEFDAYWSKDSLFVERGSAAHKALIDDATPESGSTTPGVKKGASGSGNRGGKTGAPPAVPGTASTHDANSEITREIPIPAVPDGVAHEQTGTTLPSSRLRREQIGEYDVLGTRDLHGDVLFRRIGVLERPEGKTNDTRPIRELFNLLLADARAAGARRLLLSLELIEDVRLRKVELFAKDLHGTARRINETTIEMDLPVDAPPATGADLDASAVPSTSAETTPAPPRRPDRGVVGSGGRPPRQPPGPSRSTMESPQWLYDLLERGAEPTLPPASARGEVQYPPPGGHFRRGLTTPADAYTAYNQALLLSNGREVGIYYRPTTGEYRVMIGHDVMVHGPPVDARDPLGPFVSLLHNHPNPFHAGTTRLPSPADFDGVMERYINGEARVRAFIEWDIPGVGGKRSGGRGRTEYGLDPAHPNTPFYVRVQKPGKPMGPPKRFTSIDAFDAYVRTRTRYVEQGSAEHTALIEDAEMGQTRDDWFDDD